MSTNNNEPNEIDKARGNAEKPADWTAFWKDLGINVLVITILILMIFLGSVAIYTNKVASLNLLPTDINQFPFEPDFEPLLKGKVGPIDINEINKYDSIFSFTPIETSSTKIYFNMDEINQSYKEEGFINTLNKLKYDPKQVGRFGAIGLYFRDVICTMISWNNTIINSLYGFTNKYLADWVMLILWPFIASSIYGVTTIANYFGCLIAHLVNLGDWTAKINEKSIDKVEWMPEGGFSIWRFGAMIIYGILCFMVIIPFAPIVLTVYSVLAPSSIQAKYENNDKNMPFSQFIKDTIKNNSGSIMAVLSYKLLVSATNFLGKTYASSVLLAIIIAGLVLHIYTKIDSSSSDNNKEIISSTKTTPVINPVSIPPQQRSTQVTPVTPLSQRSTPIINSANKITVLDNKLSQRSTPETLKYNPITKETIVKGGKKIKE